MTTKRPVVPETLFVFEQISDPQISPDGSVVAYVVSKADLNANKSRSALWLAPTSGGAPRRLTNPLKGSDRAPRWSPDGSQLAFISDRSGQSQLWVIDRAGGEARPIETEEQPAGAPVWSPDGRLLAFAANVFAKADDWTPYPGGPAKDRERAARAANYKNDAGNGKEEGEKPSDVKVITRFPFRRDGSGYVGDKYSHLFVVSADGSGKASRVSSGDYDHGGPRWSPDGKYLYASTRRVPAPEETRSDLWQFEVATGTPKLVYESPTSCLDPQVSPDGKQIAFVSRHAQYGWSGQSRLMLLALGDGQIADLTEQLDRPLGPHGLSDVRSGEGTGGGRWAPDGSGLYFLGGERGNSQLCHVSLTTRQVARLTRGDDRTVSAFSVGPNGAVALLIGDGAHPDELYLLEDGA
ncbi:MAG: TolB family protein, partial [Mycobacterium leprae]